MMFYISMKSHENTQTGFEYRADIRHQKRFRELSIILDPCKNAIMEL